MSGSEDVVTIGDLDSAQERAVTSPATRLCIVASAGSGKTRVIVKRIQYLCTHQGLLPEHVVAITFTRKAGFELAQRLTKVFPLEMRERPFVGTLHSFVMSELATFHDDERTPLRTLIENPVSLLEKLKIAQASKIARAISWGKTRLMSPDDVTDDAMRVIRRHVHIHPQAFDKDTFVTSWKTYERECKKRGVMDHDEALTEYCRRLSNPDYAASRHYLYRHIFVDEFQDTTPLHMEIYRRLVGQSGGLSVVGDPDQSIFSFAGSSDVYLNNFADYFPGAQSVFLNTNYRSTRANVEVARSVVPHSDQLETIITPRASTILPEVHEYPDEQSEADGVMDIISSSHARGVAMNDIAVLVRTNAQKDAFVTAANKLGMKCNRGRHVVTDPVAAQVWSTIVALRKKRRWKSIYDALDDIDNAQTLTGELDQEHKDLFRRLRNSAREYMELFPHDRHGDVAGFFEFIETRLGIGAQSTAGFSLLTFHQAKGLEFDTVIVAGFEKGLVPLYRDKVRKREEARLAYVALSRAINELHITRASVRMRHGTPVVQQPSEFLASIKSHICELDIRNDVFTADEAIKRIADIRAKHLIKKL